MSLRVGTAILEFTSTLLTRVCHNLLIFFCEHGFIHKIWHEQVGSRRISNDTCQASCVQFSYVAVILLFHALSEIFFRVQSPMLHSASVGALTPLYAGTATEALQLNGEVVQADV